MFRPNLISVLSLAVLAFPAAAQQAQPAQPAQPAHGQQGMVVVRDADTGELRAPTPLEARALHPRTNASAAAAGAPAPKMLTGPGGRRSVRLGESQMTYSVVTRDADGKLAEQCVHGAHAAEGAVAGAAGSAPAAATKPEEHHHDGR
ncbi:hypothetical protein IM543_09525 [Massilia sp. UMI-21]|nr:hypothetical protein IM543_09525 [Massilia sp. UMI-21]